MLEGWPGTETGCPEMWLSPSLEIVKRLGDVVLGTWFSGAFGSVNLTVGFNNLKGLFQPEQLYDTMNYRAYIAAKLCLTAEDSLQIFTFTRSIKHS